MKSCFNIIWFLFFLKVSNAQELQLPNIIQLSEKYYSTMNSGKITFHTAFKSSIAESNLEGEVEITFCRNLKKFNITAEGYSTYLSGKKYYFLDNQSKRFIDFSSNQSFKDEKKNYLKQYPQFAEKYFTRLRNNTFKIELVNSLIHVYDFQEHFYFDTTNYSIVKYENFSFSATGLQIKKWEIVSQQYSSDCKGVFEEKLLHGYTKVATFESRHITQKIIGEKFSALSGTNRLKMDDGSSIAPDSVLNGFILLDFFYQSCMPCIQSFGEIKKLYSTVDKGTLRIIGIDPVLADSSTISRFKVRYKLKHAILSGTEAVRLNKIFNPSGIFPFYVLVNPQGIVIKTIEGHDPELSNKVSNLMK